MFVKCNDYYDLVNCTNMIRGMLPHFPNFFKFSYDHRLFDYLLFTILFSIYFVTVTLFLLILKVHPATVLKADIACSIVSLSKVPVK